MRIEDKNASPKSVIRNDKHARQVNQKQIRWCAILGSCVVGAGKDGLLEVVEE